jgi:hypothetical protein
VKGTFLENYFSPLINHLTFQKPVLPLDKIFSRIRTAGHASRFQKKGAPQGAPDGESAISVNAPQKLQQAIQPPGNIR